MKRVLILDDDFQAASQLATRLGALGFEAYTSTTLKAVEAMQGGEVAVLVTGPQAGGRSGIDMIRLAGEISPQTSALLVGGDASAREYRLALEQGAVEVLTRPFTERDLVHAVRKALECQQGFHGTIHGISLVDLLQMMHYGRRSLTLRLGAHSAIHVEEGEIVHAVAPPLLGRDALQLLLSLPAGSLSTAPFEPCLRTIDQPFEPLLLDVLRVIDEVKGRPATAPPAPTVPEPAPLPPVFTPRRRAGRGRLLVISAVVLLAGLAVGAGLLFLLAPRAPHTPAVATEPAGRSVRQLPRSEPLEPARAVRLEAALPANRKRQSE